MKIKQCQSQGNLLSRQKSKAMMTSIAIYIIHDPSRITYIHNIEETI